MQTLNVHRNTAMVGTLPILAAERIVMKTPIVSQADGGSMQHPSQTKRLTLPDQRLVGLLPAIQTGKDSLFDADLAEHGVGSVAGAF